MHDLAASTTIQQLQLTIPLIKLDAERRLVIGRAAIEQPDRAREVMDYNSAKPQFQEWSNYFSSATGGLNKGNLRVMHDPKREAGCLQEIAFNDKEKAIDVIAHVPDDDLWGKLEKGIFTGFSVGGGYGRKWKDESDGLWHYTPIVRELSLVDSPCMPSAQFVELLKADGSIEQIEVHPRLARTFREIMAARPLSYSEIMAARPLSFREIMRR